MNEFATMSESKSMALLAMARELRSAALAGGTQRSLRGKNLALICDASDAVGAGADLFRRAASELGAKVTHLRPSLSLLSTQEEVRHTARLLGRLYEALECVGLPPELVRRIGAEAGVPVFEAISSSTHPTSRLASRLDEHSLSEDSRCAVMQAVLLTALA
jgi:ornithine carbamoyltransferase